MIPSVPIRPHEHPFRELPEGILAPDSFDVERPVNQIELRPGIGPPQVLEHQVKSQLSSLTGRDLEPLTDRLSHDSPLRRSAHRRKRTHYH